MGAAGKLKNDMNEGEGAIMQRIPVVSSNIRAIGYEEPSRVLEVEFTSGDVYRYFDVPEYLHRGLMIASSKGNFLNENIKYNYRYQKIE